MIYNIITDTLCFYFGQKGPDSKILDVTPQKPLLPMGEKPVCIHEFFEFYLSQRVFHATKTYSIDLESWNKHARHFISCIYLLFQKSIDLAIFAMLAILPHFFTFLSQFSLFWGKNCRKRLSKAPEIQEKKNCVKRIKIGRDHFLDRV